LYGVEFSQVDNPGEDRPHVGLYVAKINVDKIEDTSLVVNDYIVKAGGFEIKTEADWIEYLKTKKAGSTINIEVRRSGQTDTIPVILKLKQRQGNDIN
jgi:PDZ domain-containing secreted protein